MKKCTTMKLTAVGPLVAWLAFGCSANNPTPLETAGAGTGGIISGSGGSTGTTGIATDAGGANQGSGGSAVGGSVAGGMPSGGTQTSSASSGGSAVGGNTTGGVPSAGGSGSAKGGTPAGGSATGGTSAGGSTKGGTSAGGSAMGGASSTGGSANKGGTSSGGSAKGGASAGGSARGGASAGSSATGGTATAPTGEGFYKELFMDVGVGLDHQTTLPAADNLGWKWEFVSTDDTAVQHAYMWGDANDDNGVLLYPDREPRFMVIWTGGGYGDHAVAVGATGIKNVQDFFKNGGSYSGSCNGNYLAWDWAYKLWPGKINIDQFEGKVDATIPATSPLLKYYDFGGDNLITGLDHYKGGYEVEPLPAGTEVMLIGKSAGTAIDGNGHPTSYAYKPSASTGRVCGMNDHPEYAFQKGDVMSFFQASLHYAHDGVGSPEVKAALTNGEARMMDKSSADNNPPFTKIGDKQYHHFTVSLPNGAKDLTVTLSGDAGYDMNLYVAKDTFAFASRASQKDTSTGASKTLAVSAPESGTWYIGVECATTVTATKTTHGYDYSGNLLVLNGVKYSIKATWTQ